MIELKRTNKMRRNIHMSDFTFLTEEQIFGADQLEILKKRGTKAAVTDFSILLGAFFSDD